MALVVSMLLAKQSASKRRASSPEPYNGPRKRVRTSSPSDEIACSSSYEWYSVYSGPRLLDTQTSPFITPPDTCEFNSSPFSISKHLDASSPILEMRARPFSSLGSVGLSDQPSSSSGYILKTPLGSIFSLSSISASTRSSELSTKTTPQKQGCPRTCFCRLECDSFGKPRCIDVEQLPQIRSSKIPQGATAEGVDESNVCRMLVPRSAWNRFRVDNYPTKHVDTLVAYRGQGESGALITMVNEDLWADEKNPFLLTSSDLAEN